MISKYNELEGQDTNGVTALFLKKEHLDLMLSYIMYAHEFAMKTGRSFRSPNILSLIDRRILLLGNIAVLGVKYHPQHLVVGQISYQPVIKCFDLVVIVHQ